MSIANITIMFCKNQEELVEKYKKGGGELEKERKILIEEIEKLLKSLTYEQLRSMYIFTLQKIK